LQNLAPSFNSVPQAAQNRFAGAAGVSAEAPQTLQNLASFSSSAPQAAQYPGPAAVCTCSPQEGQNRLLSLSLAPQCLQ